MTAQTPQWNGQWQEDVEQIKTNETAEVNKKIKMYKYINHLIDLLVCESVLTLEITH